MRLLSAFLVAIPVLVVSGIVTAGIQLGGCGENVFEGTTRGDVCAVVDNDAPSYLLWLAPPIAVFTVMLLGRGRARWFLLAGVLAVAVTVHAIVAAIVSSNLFA